MTPRTRGSKRISVAGERAHGFPLEIEVRLAADVDPDTEDGAPLERARRLVLLAHVVAAVAPDAEPIARERELADLRAHRPFGHALVVHVEPGLADRLLVLSGRLPDEFHAERVLARRKLARRELLLRLDTEEVVHVVQLLVL